MNNVILIRYGEPSKYDHAVYGTICKVVKAHEPMFDIFVQLSQDEEAPLWNYVGAFDFGKDSDITNQVKKFLNQ